MPLASEYSENPSIRVLQVEIHRARKHLEQAQYDLGESRGQINTYEAQIVSYREHIADYERTIRKLLAAEATK